jgi:hypothetical protein
MGAPVELDPERHTVCAPVRLEREIVATRLAMPARRAAGPSAPHLHMVVGWCNAAGLSDRPAST